MIDQLLNILKRDYQTLNLIEISKANLIHNYKFLTSLKKIRIAPVIKSNGYGHGIINIAQILEQGCADSHVPFFCVDSLYEAYELLKAKIKTQILIMGYTDPENFRVKKLPFSFAVFDLETARILNKYQPNCKVHIFVDTGMNREGVPLNDLANFLQEIKKLSNIKIEGLMSHLASADDAKDALNNIQIKILKANERVGYGGTFLAKKEIIIGILPIGYYDGLDRRLSNKGYVKIDNIFCKIIGKVSMNITTIDISKVKNPYIGQEVIVYSSNPQDKNSISNNAKICNTIPYELLVNLASSTRRIMV